MPRMYECHWNFGYNNHIEFPLAGPPVQRPNVQLSTWEGSASISDGNGNLLFSTDGTSLWDSSDTLIGTGLGGNTSSTQSALIVPPAGGGSLYHLFCVPAGENPGPVMYSAVSVTPGISLVALPVPLPGGFAESVERVAGTSHRDCEKYWVVTVDSVGQHDFVAHLIDSDIGPSSAAAVYSTSPVSFGRAYSMKFSPDGSLLAVGQIGDPGFVHLYDFNNLTGVLSFKYSITDVNLNYHLEFSPNSKILFFTEIRNGRVYSHQVTFPPFSAASMTPIINLGGLSGLYELGQMQLGPNNKIYVVDYINGALIEIGDPNNFSSPAVLNPALDASGSAITFDIAQSLGLPTFVRVADHCVDRRPTCEEIETKVNEILASEDAGHANALPHCDSDVGVFPGVNECRPLEHEKFRPTIHITWGDSKCDCIESDDTEVMSLTICNPYSNVTLSDVEVMQVSVQDSAGNPVSLLPDGTPSITLVPIGPYCFGDIEPCSCVTRHFTLRNRGAKWGKYKIKISGICLDVVMHADTESCFEFAICKD